MTGRSLSTMIADYRSRTQQIKNSLATLVSLIEDGVPPKLETVTQSSSQFRELRDLYEQIRKEIAALPNCPPEFDNPCPIARYDTFYQDYLNRRADAVGKACETLRTFASVFSSNPHYEQAIDMYRKVAEERLLCLTPDRAEGFSLDQLCTYAEPQQRLLSYLSLTDTDTSEADSMLESMGEAFGHSVLMGLAKGRYQIAMDDVIVEEPFVDDIEPEMNRPVQIELLLEPLEDAQPEAVELVPEDAVTLVRPIKNFNTTRRAFSEKMTLLKMNVGSVLATLATHLEVCTVDQFIRMCGPLDEKKVNTQMLFEEASKKGVFAEMKLEGLEHSVFALTKCSVDCMGLEPVQIAFRKETGAAFGPFLSGHDWTRMPKARVQQMMDRSEAVVRAVSFLAKNGALSRKQSKLPFQYQDGHCFFPIQLDGQACPCLVVPLTPELMVPECGDDFGLLLSWPNDDVNYPSEEQLEKLDATGKRVLLCNKDGLSERHKQGWRVIIPGSGPAPDGNGEKETEAEKEAEPEQEASPEQLCEVVLDSALDEPGGSLEALRTRASELLPDDDAPAHTAQMLTLIDQVTDAAYGEPGWEMAPSGLVNALVLAKALTYEEQDEGEYEYCYQRMLLGSDMPMQDRCYSGDHILTVFPQPAKDKALYLATLLRALFWPENVHDYNLKALTSAVLSAFEEEFSEFAAVKPLLRLMLQVQEYEPNGFSPSVLRQFGDEESVERETREISRDAKQLRDSVNEDTFIKTRITGMLQFKRDVFGHKGDLGECMDIIATDRQSDLELVKHVYERFYVMKDGKSVVDAGMIETDIDAKWRAASSPFRTSAITLESLARTQVRRHYHERLNVIKRWLGHITDAGGQMNAALRSVRGEVLTEIDRVLSGLSGFRSNRDRVVLRHMLISLKNRLNGRVSSARFPFYGLLMTGVFGLDEAGSPLLKTNFLKVYQFEPWRNALRHIGTEVCSMETMLEWIADPDKGICFDNLGSAKKIREYLSERDQLEKPEECSEHMLNLAIREAERNTKVFTDALELTFACGRILEDVKENLLSDIKIFYEDFLYQREFGRWRGMLGALRALVCKQTEARRVQLLDEVETRLKPEEDPARREQLEQVKKLIEKPVENFAIAEEYINRYDARSSVSAYQEGSPFWLKENHFLNFIRDDYFTPLHKYCKDNKRKALKAYGKEYIRENMKLSARYLDDSQALVGCWPNRPEDVTDANVKTLMKKLGFQVTETRRVTGEDEQVRLVHFIAGVEPDKKDKSEYSHPVAAFGTRMEPELHAVFLFGQLQPDTLVSTVCGMELGSTAVVFLNGVLDLMQRRQMAERFHAKTSGHNPFILIDQALLLHLAMQESTERLPILLNCTLPYTASYKPFIDKGSVPDEMFIGRKAELSSIINPNGAIIVYGGRQLGKTTLLERARSLQHRPGEKRYAVYANVDGCGSEAMMLSVLLSQCELAGLSLGREIDTLRGLSDELSRRFQSGEIVNLLLLIDESDRFLDSLRSDEYRALLPLLVLMRAQGDRFKFVLAGLHNVCRAKEALTSNNIFGQMANPLCIQPLSPSDALQLLARPLGYLGFHTDDSVHLETILANASYYPGVLHFVGSKIVDSLTLNYGEYYRASNNPPFTLQDQQLGAIIASEGVNTEINQRIKWTLEVDDRYYLWTRCIAWLYYEDVAGSKSGYTVDEVQFVAMFLKTKLDLDEGFVEGVEECEPILCELVQMGILASPVHNVTFRLRQMRFLTAIGRSQKEIEGDIGSAYREKRRGGNV